MRATTHKCHGLAWRSPSRPACLGQADRQTGDGRWLCRACWPVQVLDSASYDDTDDEGEEPEEE